MTEPGALQQDALATARAISRLVHAAGRTVAVAESLTSGAVACHLGASGDASEWFRGGIVAYAKEVKFDVLGVEPGPVITAACARQMARGAAGLLGADFAVAVTGAGGPGPEEGRPQGTTFVAACSRTTETVEEHHFAGDPEAIVHDTVRAALALLHHVVEREQTGR